MTVTLDSTEVQPDLNDVKIHHVDVVHANAKNFEQFGTIVTDYEAEQVEIKVWPAQGWRKVDENTGDEGGITEGPFEMFRQGDMMCAENHAVNGHYITGWFGNPADADKHSNRKDYSRIYVREANYHPDGGQVFYPREGQPFIALLALPGDDIKPEDFIAFYCDGSFGVQIKPNIWHQPPFSVNERMVFDDKQGAVHACISVDFINEFNTYISFEVKAPS